MIWEIRYTEEAKQDLKNIYEYISYELQVMDTAVKQTRRIMDGIRSLEEMPMRYRRYEEETWHGFGLRAMPIDNYIVFYLPIEADTIANIVRIMYDRRDVAKQLDEVDLLSDCKR